MPLVTEPGKGVKPGFRLPGVCQGYAGCAVNPLHVAWCTRRLR